MSFENIIFIIFGILLFGGLIVCAYFGKNYLRYHHIFAPVIEVLCSCIKGISGMMPNNMMLKTLSIIMNTAVEATEMAERLWLDCTIDKEQRNAYAMNYIANILEKANIEVNDNIQAIIDGVIAATCYLLPHGRVPIEEEV